MDCSNPNSSNREAIVDKLHGVLASLRRERDELHRKKALAKERLHLFQEEKEAMGKTYALAQGKLEALQQSSNDKALQEFNHLEHEVSRLTKEVSFSLNVTTVAFIESINFSLLCADIGGFSTFGADCKAT
jgi:GMP synthase PP-ATPase subunit